jgi:hypothetical protein
MFWIISLKGQLHEIVDHRFFSSFNPIQGPDSRAKAVLNMPFSGVIGSAETDFDDFQSDYLCE